MNANQVALPTMIVASVPRRLMVMSSNGNIFPLVAICAGTGEFPAQRPVARSFGVFLDLRLTKRLG